MPDRTAAKMLEALELFHYSSRFYGQRFVIAFDRATSLKAVLLDLRILRQARIPVILVCAADSLAFTELEATTRYAPLQIVHHPSIDVVVENGALAVLTGELRRILRSQLTPVVVIGSEAIKPDKKPAKKPAELQNDIAACAIARMLHAKKVFLINQDRGLFVDGVFVSHPTPAELRAIFEDDRRTNISKERLRGIYSQSQDADRNQLGSRLEVILLEAIQGALFREIFTHEGEGTLFTRAYPNRVREARPEDLQEIQTMMRPYVARGAVLPMTDEQLSAALKTFFVYTVNDAVVAAACLIPYGEAAELGKFCTYPRYQGRGRARRLAIEMMAAARKAGYRYVFALSIEPKMWEFFHSLGFTEISRGELPQLWRENYDFTRPSRAFRFSW